MKKLNFNYIKKGTEKNFQKVIDTNKDFYGGGCVQTAITVMKSLMNKKLSVEECWHKALKNSGHSGMSAAITATIIAHYSPRGNEFKRWCIKNNEVMVDWKTR